jgi:hypothetical protein
VDLDKEKASTAFRYQCILFQVTIELSHYPWLFIAIFVRQWVKKPLVLPFWCLMSMGEKLRPKQLDQLPLVNFSKI